MSINITNAMAHCGTLEIQSIKVTHVYYLELWEIYSIISIFLHKPTIRRENTLQAVQTHLFRAVKFRSEFLGPKIRPRPFTLCLLVLLETSIVLFVNILTPYVYKEIGGRKT